MQHRLLPRSNALRDLAQSIFPGLLAVALGLALGAMMVLRRGMSDTWAAALVVAVIGVVAVLLVADLKKIIWLAFVVDVPLNLDVAIQNHGEHSGGPTGFIISLATFALVAGYAVWIVNRRPRLRAFYSLTLPGSAFLLAAILSILQSVNVQFSLFSIFMISQFLLMYIFLINHATSIEDLRFVLNTIAACLLVEGIFMIVQYFTGASLSFAGVRSRSVLDMSESVGGVRVAGTVGSPNAAASYLAPTLAIVFGAYLTKGKLINRTLAVAAFGLGLVALVLTAVRSGWISFAIALLITVLQAARTRTGQRAVLIVLVFLAIVGLLFSERIIFRLTKDDRNSAESREWLAEMAFNIIEAHPVGVGVNNYDQVMSDKYASRELIGHTLRVVHNKYLLIWAEMGPWGLVAFIWLLVAAVGRGMKWVVKCKEPPHLSILVASLVGGLVGYAVNMNSEAFGGRIRDQFLWFMIALVVVTSQLIIKSRSKPAGADVRASGL